MIKIQLYHASAGTLTVTPDAEGTEDFEQTLKRSEATDGIVYEYSLDLQFNKVSKEYLRNVFEVSGGIEAVVVCNIFEYMPNAFSWDQIGAGTIKFTNFDLSAERLKTSIEQTGLVRKTLNSLDVDVDLATLVSQGGVTLPPTPVVDMLLHSKVIVKEFRAIPNELIEFQQENVFEQTGLPGLSSTYRERIIFGNFSTEKAEVEELADSFTLPFGWADTGAGMGHAYSPATEAEMIAYLETELGHRFPIHTAAEAGILDVTATLKFKMEISAIDISGDVNFCGTGALGLIEIRVWFERRNAANEILEIILVDEYIIPQCGEAGNDGNNTVGTFQQIDVSQLGISEAVGDKVYIYHTVRVYADYENDSSGSESVSHHFRIEPQDGYVITFKSDTVTPPTRANAYLIFEALKKMFQFYTDQLDCFRSDYFGRTDSSPSYPVDGPGSLRTILSGAAIRQVPDKTTFVNGNDFFGGLNAIDCLGFGFEFVDGRQVARVEPIEYFYNKDLLILDLGPVSDLHRIVETKQYYNQIENNYGKIDIQKTNGIDEFGTLRRWKFPITQSAAKLLATTKYKISGAEIEDQRRKITSTEDAKNDDANFFIQVVRLDASFIPKTDEGYILIEGLFSPETAYNLDLSPRRNLDNWLKVVAVSLYKSPTKSIVFSSGEGNYFLVTQKTGEPAPKPEGGPGVTVDLSQVAPLYMPERYKFAVPLSAADMQIIRQNPYGYFIFQEFRGGPNLEGYLSKVTRNAKKKLGTFELMKLFR